MTLERKRSLKIILVVFAVLALGVSMTTAAPLAELEPDCVNVNRALPVETEVSASIARQLEAPSADILQSFGY